MADEQPAVVIKEKTFRLAAAEDAKLEKLIEFAHMLGDIKKPTLQEFMVFAINCAYEHLKKEYTERKTG